MMTAHSRLAARLAALPHNELLAVTALACEQSDAVHTAVEDSLVAQSPFPDWAREFVILSTDLMPHLFGSFQLEHHAVKGVCKAWRGAWAETLEERRVLRPGPELVAPWDHGFLLHGATPNGDMLLLGHGDRIYFFDRQMQNKASLWLPGYVVDVAIGQNSIISTWHDTFHHYRYSVRGNVLTYKYDDVEVQDNLPDVNLYRPVISPCGLLFCVGYDDEDDDAHDEIMVFDSRSLLLQCRFGSGLLSEVRGMAVVRTSLYVCDCNNDCIKVFSFTGQLLRTIRGEWRQPASIVCVRDRLYLTEYYDYLWSEYDGYGPEMGRRVFVMSLAGVALQTYAPELAGDYDRLGEVMAVFGDNLVLKVAYSTKLIALRGL